MAQRGADLTGAGGQPPGDGDVMILPALHIGAFRLEWPKSAFLSGHFP